MKDLQEILEASLLDEIEDTLATGDEHAKLFDKNISYERN